MSKVIRSNESKRTISTKASRLRKKKKPARDGATPTRAEGFKVDKSPAARAFGKAVSQTHKRLYGE